MAADASAPDGAGWKSSSCKDEDLQVNGGSAGATEPTTPTTPTTPTGGDDSEADGAASLAGYGAIAVATLAAIAN